MKTEFDDLSETRKRLRVEIPSPAVDAEIQQVTREFARSARVPGFRQGKVPTTVAKQRYREQILHEVAHRLVPRAVEDALREHGVEPLDTPDVRDVEVDEGQPLRFSATFETLPAVDPGSYETLALRRPPAVLEANAVDEALERLQRRMARYEPVEDRPVGAGDIVTVDLDRQPNGTPAPEHHQDVSIELGAEANPPGFDDELLGMTSGAEKEFTVTYPAEYPSAELAGSSVHYRVTLKGIRRRVLPPVDDELAKDLEVDSLEALRERVRQDLLKEVDANADRQLRRDLLKELASRVTAEVPQTLVDQEMDRRTEELARQLMDQRLDPRQAGIDWDEVRESQRQPSTDAVRSSLVLDEIARRETLSVSDADLEQEVARYAEQSGRTPAVVRATLEKDGGVERLRPGLLREKSIEFLLAHANIDRR